MQLKNASKRSENTQTLVVVFTRRWDVGTDQKGGEPVAASIPVMLTRQMEVDLRRRGFTQGEINRMTPQQANNILAGEAPENAPAAVAVEDTEGEL